MKRAVAASFEELEHHVPVRTDITHTEDPIKQKSGHLITLMWSGGGGIKEEDKIINLSHKEKIRVIEYYYYSDITYITKL